MRISDWSSDVCSSDLSRMLKFVDVGQQMPDKRKAEAGREDFDEIYRRFDPERAAVQAGRCSQCGIPFCQTHCPLHNNIPDWQMLTADGRMEDRKITRLHSSH